MKIKRTISPIESRILAELIKKDDYMTTAEVANNAKVSWNTALSYLKKFESKGWVEKLGDRTLYWKAILE